jgi:hypothetical protein
MNKVLLTVMVAVALLTGNVQAEDANFGDWLYKNPSVFTAVNRVCDVFGFPKIKPEDKENSFGVFAGPYGPGKVILGATIFKDNPLFEVLSNDNERHLIYTTDSVITADIHRMENLKNLRFLIDYDKLVRQNHIKIHLEETNGKPHDFLLVIEGFVEAWNKCYSTSH